MSFKIIGTGSYLPPLTVTNDDLAKTIDTSDEWITQRIGIKSRRISEDESTAEMGYKAAKEALTESGTAPEELDLIIAASITGDTICPTTAGGIQKLLGATCPAFDINSACSGFVFALDTAAGFFARGTVKKVLVVGSERISKIVDWKDRNTCVIFGDGAGAAVLTEGDGYLDSKISTFGGDDVIKIPSGLNLSPYYKKETELGKIYMAGQETFKFAVSRISEDIKYLCDRAGITAEDIDRIVPHQANERIIDYAAKRLHLPKEKFFVNIESYGNTSAASIAIALAELDHKGGLKKGDKIILTAFGGGLSSASCLIEW